LDPLSLDRHTAIFAKLVRVGSSIALFAGILFFLYQVYVGTFLNGGSTQVFIGLACLILLLVSNLIIEKIVLKVHDEKEDKQQQ
jgi:hypothetical protein